MPKGQVKSQKGKKESKYFDLYKDLDLSELATFNNELSKYYNEKVKEAEELKTQAAIRNKIKLGYKAVIELKGEEVAGDIVGILMDKVTIQLPDGGNKNIPYRRIVRIEKN